MELKKIFSFRESEDEERPFMDHLADLRVMIIRIAVVLVVAMVGAFFFRDILAAVIQRPLVVVDPSRAASLVVICTLAAFIAPSPDLVTYFLMAGPMVVLYEGCIHLARWLEPKPEAGLISD